MLARKAVVGQVKGDMLVIAQGRRRSANVALDLSPMMWQVVYGIAALVACLLIKQIAEQQLGMVLPDSFVYSTKSAVTERNVQEKQQIID